MPMWNLALLAALSATPAHQTVRGVTISCQTWGWEWGTEGYGRELDRLRALGVNWVAIHPYAGITTDGRVRPFGLDDPGWLTRPIAAAHARGMAILIKPHLAYWRSGFSWRGDIVLEGAARERFFSEYRDWMVGLARITRDADAFVVGTELEGLVGHEREWRAVIAAVRQQTRAHLTYAANWTDYDRVGFWDALDAIGVQAYFPLTEQPNPSRAILRSSWRPILAELRRVSARIGKPVVFTELGYHPRRRAAAEPWKGGPSEPGAAALQHRLLDTALAVLESERDWLRGAFLWKWFVGPAPREDFPIDTPEVRALLRARWE